MMCPFFLSVPARAPRTEWVCHAVAAASSAMLAPVGCRRRPTRVSSFDFAATYALLLFGVLRPTFALDEVLLMLVPFSCAAPDRRRYRHKPASRADTAMLRTAALSTGKWR
jgi:hypothetical protein